MTDADRDLRERFERLRAEDARGAPSFSALLQRGRSRVPAARVSRLRPILALAAVLALAALLVSPRRTAPPSVPSTPPLALDHWRAPTDFLLDTPGRQLLGEVPSFGSDLSGFSPASPVTERNVSP